MEIPFSWRSRISLTYWALCKGLALCIASRYNLSLQVDGTDDMVQSDQSELEHLSKLSLNRYFLALEGKGKYIYLTRTPVYKDSVTSLGY